MTLTERRGRNWLSKILLLTNLSHDCIRQLGLYKNMACGQKGNNAQFKCVAGKADCCCCWLLFTHDFVSQKSHLEDLIHVIISVIFTQNTNKMSSNSLSNTASRGCKTLLSEQLKNPILMKWRPICKSVLIENVPIIQGSKRYICYIIKVPLDQLLFGQTKSIMDTAHFPWKFSTNSRMSSTKSMDRTRYYISYPLYPSLFPPCYDFKESKVIPTVNNQIVSDEL